MVVHTATLPVQSGNPVNGSAHAPRAKRGSEHIKYDRCNRYDEHRRPIGISRLARGIRGVAERLSKPLSAMNGVSFACGTGLNEAELFSRLEEGGDQLGHLLCSDASDGMLSFVSDKLAGSRSGWDTRTLDVVRDEFDFEKIDFAMIVQATQHIDRFGTNYPNARLFFRKVRERMATGGSLFTIISTPSQVLRSHWFINVLTGRPEISAEDDPGVHFAREHAELHTMVEMLHEAGFAVRKQKVLGGPHFREESYFGDPRIVQDETFRHASSFFWIARDRGLIHRYDERVAEMLDAGELEAHRESCEGVRRHLGVSNLLEAVAI